MATVSGFLDKVKNVDVKSLTKAVIQENERQIINLNRKDQIFDKGIDSEGKVLGNYSPSTQAFYDKDDPNDPMGSDKRAYSRFNLFWTGQSYYGFRAYMKGLKMFITTNSRGRKLLIENGGANVFGLTTENDRKVNWEIIAPKLNEKIRKILL